MPGSWWLLLQHWLYIYKINWDIRAESINKQIEKYVYYQRFCERHPFQAQADIIVYIYYYIIYNENNSDGHKDVVTGMENKKILLTYEENIKVKSYNCFLIQ